MLMGAEAFAMQPDPVALLRGYNPEGKRLMLAARVIGDAKSAFPEGAPKPEEKKDDAAKEAKDAPKAPEKPAKPHVASGRINAIVIADTDLLADQFWVEVRDFLGLAGGSAHGQQRGLRGQHARQPRRLRSADHAARPRR